LAWNEKKLEQEINSFIEFLETEKEFQTQKNLLKDLAKWNVFLLTTRDNDTLSKSETFNFNWKDFFTMDTSLEETQKIYTYENPVTSNDGKTWSWETIFLGRWVTKFKIHPSSLTEIRQVFQY